MVRQVKIGRFSQTAYTSGVDCVVNTTKIFGGMADGSSYRLLGTDINLDGINLEVWILSSSLGLSSRLLGPLHVDVSHDQATGPIFGKG